MTGKNDAMTDSGATGPAPGIRIVLPEQRHHPDWRRLYQGYAEFYRVPMDDAIADRLWSWIMDPAIEVEARLAVTPDDRVVGLAHFREMARPLTASWAGFLDDLFVDPAHRGGRVGELLIDAVVEVMKERGWTVLRWITAEDNDRARALYDRVAARTRWVTYEIKPDDRRDRPLIPE